MSTTQHVARLHDALAGFDQGCTVLESWGAALTQVLTAGGRLLAAGNGGSAAQAQHLTAELVGRYQGERRPFSAICLSAETSSLTAITNDYPPEELFARQVEAHGRPGDVFVGLSTSGSSANVVNAALRARACGLDVWALTGPAPNPLADAADSYVAIDAPSTATVQEMHLVALHLLCEVFDEHLRQEEPSTLVADLAEARR
ncbi:D-sedoheptulose-7-phosphate isomerase [Mumia sp. DW29H23]|uniref:D-sedoheptulose-7-phosphate isomerase n=1 Tax=Mumia sp. DW29H23 TaxID=3421241 RepID=UPI003D6964C4